MMNKLILTQPDDWHLHIRDGNILKTVLPFTASQFGRAIIMPNLKPPVTTVTQALDYRAEILAAIPQGLNFQPLMTLYLTPSTTQEEIKKAAESDYIHAFKLYPAGATTHSDDGIAHLESIYPLFEAMEKHDIPLLVHGEVTDPEADIFDRERLFIERHLYRIADYFPQLRIVVEHVTTQEAVDFVNSASSNVAATITPQHLLYNRNTLLAGGIRPHYYCLPVLKREQHRQALIAAATSGNTRFFLGTDSAPHQTHLKENACGCAGCFSAHAAIELYAEVFEQADALDKLEGFASFHGPDFYRLPRNSQKITLIKASWTVPQHYEGENVSITPLKAGAQISWKLSSGRK